jgi:hypothetical protein
MPQISLKKFLENHTDKFEIFCPSLLSDLKPYNNILEMHNDKEKIKEIEGPRTRLLYTLYTQVYFHICTITFYIYKWQVTTHQTTLVPAAARSEISVRPLGHWGSGVESRAFVSFVLLSYLEENLGEVLLTSVITQRHSYWWGFINSAYTGRIWSNKSVKLNINKKGWMEGKK